MTEEYVANGRTVILEKAEQCVNGSREQDYGTPESNFSTIASLWETYLNSKHNTRQVRDELISISPVDVAMMMSLLKIARVSSGNGTEDCYVDLAGYAACAGEIYRELYTGTCQDKVLGGEK